MEIPQHLMQHVASQVIGGGGGGSGYPSAPDHGEQGYNAEYYQQYSQYWSQYAAWQQWQQQYWEQSQQQSNGGGGGGGGPPQPPAPPAPAEKTKAEDPHSLLVGPLNQLVEHTRKPDTSSTSWLAETEEMWESIEESRWWQPSV